MKIMYTTNQLYEHGGIEKILTNKINYWIEKYGYDVILCTSEQRKNTFVYSLNSNAKHIDLGINYLKGKSYFYPQNLIKSVRHYFKLKYIINIHKPDVIISVNNTPEQFFIPLLAKGIPTVKEFHSSGYNLHKKKSLFNKCKYQLFLLLNKYTIKVVLNQDEKKYYPFNGIEVIPNFVISQKKENFQRENVIIAAGRIAPVKQFNHLIEAWSKIAYEFPNWKVYIFGDGDKVLKQQLQNQIKQLHTPRIIFKDATFGLDEVMQHCSIFAMTSLTECFPMVLIEAQAAGMAVISYDCPNGPRNIIKHNIDGILVSDQNIELFALELKRLISNNSFKSKIQIKAKQNVNQYSENKIMNKWDLLLKSIKK